MSPENWRRVDSIYNEVLDQPAEERDKFLAAARTHFPSEVLAMVEKLLRSPDEDDSALAKALDTWITRALGNHWPGGMPPPDRSIPRWLWDLADRHDYEIQELLGHGGQGCVYLAYDRRYREMVALKTMHYVDAPRPDALSRSVPAPHGPPSRQPGTPLRVDFRRQRLVHDHGAGGGHPIPGVRPLRCR